MNAGKKLLTGMLAVSSVVNAQLPAVKLAAPPATTAPAPATIGQLSELARQKRITDETKPTAPAVPPGMTIVPSTAIVSSSAPPSAPKAVAKAPKPTPPAEVVPGLLAIARGPGGSRYVELADVSGHNKYMVGQVTPSGWIVQSIGAKFVELEKPATKKKPSRQLVLSIVNQ